MDFLERIYGQWQTLRPEMNSESFLTIGRIMRVASFMNFITGEVIEKHGITRGEFELLAALRRSSKNCRATELSALTKSSGAAITKRLDRLSGLGYITRQALPRDRRVVLVNLTDEGRELIDILVPAVLSKEFEYLSDFDAEELKQFEGHMAKLVSIVDSPDY